MSKVSPVRWWRDDKERYRARPLIGACRPQPDDPAWTFEPLSTSSTDPGLTVMREWADLYAKQWRPTGPFAFVLSMAPLGPVAGS
jgi:hypothetical protein